MNMEFLVNQFAEAEIQMLNGRCVSDALVSFNSFVSEDELLKCFDASIAADESSNCIQRELKRVLNNGVNNGFIVRRGCKYGLASLKNVYETDADDDDYSGEESERPGCARVLFPAPKVITYRRRPVPLDGGCSPGAYPLPEEPLPRVVPDDDDSEEPLMTVSVTVNPVANEVRAADGISEGPEGIEVMPGSPISARRRLFIKHAATGGKIVARRFPVDLATYRSGDTVGPFRGEEGPDESQIRFSLERGPSSAHYEIFEKVSNPSASGPPETSLGKRARSLSDDETETAEPKPKRPRTSSRKSTFLSKSAPADFSNRCKECTAKKFV